MTEAIRPVLQALRPRQWTKNLLLLAGLIFAVKLGDPHRWLEALGAVAAYCAASSAAYLVNDVRDAPYDRLHPVKRRRPVARGALSSRTALTLAAALAAVAIGLAAMLGLRSLAYLLGFVAIQAAYSAGLKRVALVDVLTIASLFVIRAAAGAEAVHVHISPWLLTCTALLAVFLALGKRRAELALVAAAQSPGREALRAYSARVVDRLIAVAAVLTVVSYVLYTLTGSDTREMAITIPFVVAGILRYLRLLRGHGLGEEPENVLLGDRQIQASVLAWAGCAALVLMVG